MSDGSEPIIPRWEWRAFDRRFTVAEPLFDSLEPTEVRKTEEMYLLVQAAGTNVKMRFDLIDIKVLEDVDRNGLERWRPVFKAAFPLEAPDVEEVFALLDRPLPDLDRDSYTLDQLIAELAEPARMRPVAVTKRRVRYAFEGCTAEVSDVVVDGRPIRTVALESADASSVIDAVRALGLDGYTNMNYTRGITAMVDEQDVLFGVVDVGTNSIKFHLAARSPSGGWHTIVDRAEVTRLGEGLDKAGRISNEALERTASAIAGMVDEARERGARAIAAVGTAGLRIASNREEVVAAIRDRAGITVEVISGEDESRLAYMAAQAGLDLGDGSIVVFDTGGGSSEFTFGRGSRVDDRFSLNVGAVRYTERFHLEGQVPGGVLAHALSAMSKDLGSLDEHPAPDALVAMGGAVTNMAAVKHGLADYDPDVVNGTVLTRNEIDRQVELYASTSTEARRSIVGLQPKRAEIILAGACIVGTVMDKLGAASATVSDRGLRHGLLVERFGP